MHGPAREAEHPGRQEGRDGLAFAGVHLGDAAPRQGSGAGHLLRVGLQLKCATGIFTRNRQRLDNIVVAHASRTERDSRLSTQIS